MPLYDSPALILKNFRMGETDKLVTFFTSRHGKVKAVAKGAYKTKSRYGGRLEPFVYGKMIVFGKEKASIFRLNAIDVIDPFLGLRNDFKITNRAFVAAELVDVTQNDWDPHREVFAELLGFYRRLAEPGRDRGDLPLRFFELRYLALIGYRPRLAACVHCGGPPTGRENGFNAAKGGVVCGACLSGDRSALRVTPGAVKLMERGLSADAAGLARLTAAPPVADQIGRVVNEMVERHTRRRLRSERFLRL
jgi:DNA repair protein RecO (recombination protein O)